jgi:hypothetical protein
MKVCTKCKIEKDISDFTFDKSRNDGFCAWCKNCKRISAERYSARKTEDEKRLDQEKQNARRKKKPELYSASKKRHYQRHKDRILLVQKLTFPVRAERKRIARMFKAIGETETDWVTE